MESQLRNSPERYASLNDNSSGGIDESSVRSTVTAKPTPMDDSQSSPSVKQVLVTGSKFRTNLQSRLASRTRMSFVTRAQRKRFQNHKRIWRQQKQEKAQNNNNNSNEKAKNKRNARDEVRVTESVSSSSSDNDARQDGLRDDVSESQRQDVSDQLTSSRTSPSQEDNVPYLGTMVDSGSAESYALGIYDNHDFSYKIVDSGRKLDTTEEEKKQDDNNVAQSRRSGLHATDSENSLARVMDSDIDDYININVSWMSTSDGEEQIDSVLVQRFSDAIGHKPVDHKSMATPPPPPALAPISRRKSLPESHDTCDHVDKIHAEVENLFNSEEVLKFVVENTESSASLGTTGILKNCSSIDPIIKVAGTSSSSCVNTISFDEPRKSVSFSEKNERYLVESYQLPDDSWSCNSFSTEESGGTYDSLGSNKDVKDLLTANGNNLISAFIGFIEGRSLQDETAPVSSFESINQRAACIDIGNGERDGAIQYENKVAKRGNCYMPLMYDLPTAEECIELLTNTNTFNENTQALCSMSLYPGSSRKTRQGSTVSKPVRGRDPTARPCNKNRNKKTLQSKHNESSVPNQVPSEEEKAVEAETSSISPSTNGRKKCELPKRSTDYKSPDSEAKHKASTSIEDIFRALASSPRTPEEENEIDLAVLKKRLTTLYNEFVDKVKEGSQKVSKQDLFNASSCTPLDANLTVISDDDNDNNCERIELAKNSSTTLGQSESALSEHTEHVTSNSIVREKAQRNDSRARCETNSMQKSVVYADCQMSDGASTNPELVANQTQESSHFMSSNYICGVNYREVPKVVKTYYNDTKNYATKAKASTAIVTPIEDTKHKHRQAPTFPIQDIFIQDARKRSDLSSLSGIINPASPAVTSPITPPSATRRSRRDLIPSNTWNAATFETEVFSDSSEQKPEPSKMHLKANWASPTKSHVPKCDTEEDNIAILATINHAHSPRRTSTNDVWRKDESSTPLPQKRLFKSPKKAERKLPQLVLSTKHKDAQHKKLKQKARDDMFTALIHRNNKEATQSDDPDPLSPLSFEEFKWEAIPSKVDFTLQRTPNKKTVADLKVQVTPTTTATTASSTSRPTPKGEKSYKSRSSLSIPTASTEAMTHDDILYGAGDTEFDLFDSHLKSSQ